MSTRSAEQGELQAAARVIGLYQRHAEAWARDRGTRLSEGAWLDDFQALMPARGQVLDLGCGAGEPLAATLARRGYSITGVDSAPAMIAMCRKRLPDQAWLIADMRTLALGRTFDGLLVWDSFFHLCHDNQRRMFPIFSRHAHAGAALMFTSGTSHGESVGAYEGEPLYHASLDTAEYRALLGEAGFAVVRHVVEDAACGGRTVWLARKKGLLF